MRSLVYLFSINLLIFILFFYSCENNNGLEKKSIKKEKDTLIVDNNTFKMNNLTMSIFLKNKKLNYFPKGEISQLKCKFQKQFKNLLKSSELYFYVEDTIVRVTKSNNHKFNIYIPKTYSKNDIIIDAFIKPHADFIINSKLENIIVDSSNFISVSRFAWLVK